MPSPDEYAALVRHAERTENVFGAITLNTALIRVLHVRGEFEQARDIADASVQRNPFMQHWHADAALACLALGDIQGAKERAGRLSLPTEPVPNLLVCETAVVLVARHAGELTGAETIVHRLLAAAFEHGHVRDLLTSLEMLAGLAAAQGSWQHAARLAGAAQEKRDAHPLKSRIEPIRSMLEADLATTRTALGDAAYESAFTEGRGLSIDDAVEYAQRSRGERLRPTIGWTSLTPTERRVVDLARLARTNVEIARELLMGAETVKTHLSHAYAKLGVANRTQLATLSPPPANSGAESTR